MTIQIFIQEKNLTNANTVTPVLQAIPHMLCINELILVFPEVPRDNFAHSHTCGLRKRVQCACGCGRNPHTLTIWMRRPFNCINELILVFSEVPRDNFAHSQMCVRVRPKSSQNNNLEIGRGMSPQ